MFKQSSAPLSDVRISFTSSDHDDNCFNNCYDLLVEHQNFVRSATIEAKSAIYEYLDLMLINGDSSISQETISQEMLETIKGSDDILVFLKGLYVSLSIKYASDRIRNDPWLVLRASRFDTESINFASTKLKLNRDFAIKAIEINPTAIKYLPNFADDYEIGLSCVKENGLTLNYLSNNLKSNTTIILEAIQSDGKAFDFMPDHLKTRELLERAIATSSDVPKFPAEFNSDPSFILKYIRRNSHFYSSDIDENLFDNEDFCLQVSQFGIYWDNIKDLPSVFVNEELMLEIIATDAHHIETISELVDEEFCFLAVQLQPECLDYIDLSQFDRNTFMDLLTNTEICEKIISLDDFKDDREFVLKSIRVSNLTMLMSYVSETIKSDRNIIIEALVKCPFSLESMLEETKEDQEIIDIALFRNSEVLHFISQKFLDDIDYCLKSVQNSSSPEFNDVFIGLSETREEVLQLIKNIPHFSIDGVPRNLLLDREIVSLILQERGYQFKYLPKTLKSDRELVLIGVRNRLLLNLVLPKFRHDREIVIEAVKSSGLNLGYVPEQFQDDEEIVFLSCLHPGFSSGLMFASKRLRGDKNFMSKVLALHGYHLQYASTNLKQDKDIVKIAIETGEDCFAYASYELRMDRELVLLAINKNSGAVRYITSDELLKDREIIEVAFRESTNLLKYLNWENMIDLDFLLKTECKEFILRSIPYRFRHGKSIIQKAIMSTPNSLLYVTELEYQKELRNNRIVMLNAIKSKPNLFPYCSQELIQNEDFILDALRVNGLVLQYLPLGHICNREIVKIAVLQNGESLEHASNELRMDSEIVLVAVQQNGSALRFTSPKLKNDKKIVLEAVKSNAKAFEFASFELRTDQSFVMEVIEINIESLHNAHYSLRYNIEFLRKINKDNRLVENTSIELKKVIDLNGLLGYEPLLTIHLFGNVNKRKVNSDLVESSKKLKYN